MMMMMMMKLSLLLVASLALLTTASASSFVVPPRPEHAAAPYPQWAHHHMVWLSNDRANQSSLIEYVQEYVKHDIAVGAVDVDSRWESGFNTFQFNTDKYPNTTAMVDYFHSLDVKVIFWITSMIDNDTALYEEAVKKDYVVKNGLGQPGLLKWWHGHGCLLDYTNPEAVEWWHGLMDNVLKTGIDGWKVDGTDPYIMELVTPKGHNGTITYREYADLYYGDFFDYTRQQLGDDRLIFSRPVDGVDPIFLDFSPRRVQFMGWVGDQDPTFHGLDEALKRIIMSGWDNYTSFGSDIGGYRNGPGELGRTVELFTRWFQLGAFSAVMENGGEKEHRPWMFDQPGSTTIVDTYRTFTSAHMQLVPYLYSAGVKAYADGHSIVTPIATYNDTKSRIFPSTYDYLLGGDLFVSPIHDNVTVWNVSFPAGAKWVSYWDHTKTYAGNTTLINESFPLTTYPVYSRAGAILPLKVVNDHLPLFGDESSADALTLNVRHPLATGEVVERDVEQDASEHGGLGWHVRYSFDGHVFSINVTANPSPLIVNVVMPEPVVGDVKVVQRTLEGTVAVPPMPSLGVMARKSVGVVCDRSTKASSQSVFVRPHAPHLGVSLDMYF